MQPATTPTTQKAALLAGKASSLQDRKGSLKSWQDGTDHCKWAGAYLQQKLHLPVVPLTVGSSAVSA
jgi:hypothetical protein